MRGQRQSGIEGDCLETKIHDKQQRLQKKKLRTGKRIILYGSRTE